MQNKSPSTQSDAEHKKSNHHSHLIVITRVLQAPMEWIWKAWSDAEIIKLWWGTKGYISKKAKLDFRVGGKYLFEMVGPDGKIKWSTGTYEEIIPHKKITFTDQFSDKEGNIISGSDLGMPGCWPKKLYVTIEFVNAEQIKLVIFHEGIPKEMHNECVEGWNQSIDKLQEIVERYGDEHLKPNKLKILN